MKKKVLGFLYIVFFIFKTTTLFSAQTVEANGLLFITDIENPQLEKGSIPVFPYSDEATVLLEIATKIKEERGEKFALVIDPFCGDGKSGLPMLSNEIAEQLLGSDINPRAVEYAKENAKLNLLDAKSQFVIRDIMKEGVSFSEIPGNTLWIANPPFGLKVKGANLDIMRDGGENGLALTLAFVSSALQYSKPGDVILGIGYSRIQVDGTVELEGEIQELIKKFGGNLRLVLLEGKKLWRGFNGIKEQNNPMPITKTIFSLKANPENQEEIIAYQNAALFHNQSGYNKLGYYTYIIKK